MTGTSSGDVYSFGFEVDRGLGEVELVSSQTLSPFSRAGWQAADNLLTKAKRWFTSGDENRAMALVDRAAALPYDDHEDAAPAVLAAGMMLFSAITDELERSDEADYAGWAPHSTCSRARTKPPALRCAMRWCRSVRATT